MELAVLGGALYNGISCTGGGSGGKDTATGCNYVCLISMYISHCANSGRPG